MKIPGILSPVLSDGQQQMYLIVRKHYGHGSEWSWHEHDPTRRYTDRDMALTEAQRMSGAVGVPGFYRVHHGYGYVESGHEVEVQEHPALGKADGYVPHHDYDDKKGA